MKRTPSHDDMSHERCSEHTSESTFHCPKETLVKENSTAQPSSSSSECMNSKKQKLEDSSYPYDTHHQIIPHNPQYRYFIEHDIFRIVSKYFPKLRQLKQDTPVPIPNSDKDLEMFENVKNSDSNNSTLLNEKEKNTEKQRYAVQRRIAFLLIDHVFKQCYNRCCPFCWLPIDFCACKSFIYAWRENTHLRFNDSTLNLGYSKHNKPNESQIQEMMEIVKHSEQSSPLQNSEPHLKFILLMHAKEFFRKSNTGKVLMDTLPDGFVEIYLVDVEEHEREFCEKYHLKPGDNFEDNLTFLLFPSDDARDLDENFIKSIKEKQEQLSSSLLNHSANTVQKQPRKPINLILIDSTWYVNLFDSNRFLFNNNNLGNKLSMS